MTMPTDTASPADLDADRALKSKHRAMWASGDYPTLASDLIAGFGPVLVDAAQISAGDRVLDIAAGSGNVAIPAAQTGATVVASDLTPELFDVGRRAAAAQGVDLDWVEGDAERLPFADAEFDVAVSAVGIMFAPHHQESADELVRVVRPGGRIALASWTREGFIGAMFAAMKPYAPPPPPGAQPPPLWGSEDHVRDLLGDRVTDLRFERRVITITQFPGADEFRDYFKERYGPTISTYKAIAGDPDRVQALDAALAEVGARYDLGEGRMEWEYLLVTARRA